MILKRIPTGMFGSNCYILGDGGEGAVIDPGVDTGEIMEVVDEAGLAVKYIILTHAHIDHICSVDELRDRTGAKVLVHEADAPSLPDSWLNGSAMFGLRRTFREADVLLKDGDIVNLGGLKLQIIHTPGHTPGSICINVENIVLTGDTLFRMSIGRTDLGNGDQDALIRSITGKLFNLGDDTVIYPGHYTSSTIGYEKRHNPFV